MELSKSAMCVLVLITTILSCFQESSAFTNTNHHRFRRQATAYVITSSPHNSKSPLNPGTVNSKSCDDNPNPTHAESLSDLLRLCCSTNDGIERDCCALVYPDIPPSQRRCSCATETNTRNRCQSFHLG